MPRTLEVKVVPNAKRNALKEEAGILKVYLTAPPVDGKANKALIDFLADHFDVKKSQIAIIKGLQSRRKTIIINAY